MQPLVTLLEQVGDLGEDLDLQVLAADLVDDPLHHLGVGLQKAHLELGEAGEFAGEVVHEADDPARIGLQARHHVEGAQPHLLGERPALDGLVAQVGDEERLQKPVVGDDPRLVDVAGDQRRPVFQVDAADAVVAKLQFGILRVACQHLHAAPRRDQHRGEGEAVDQVDGGADHEACRLPSLVHFDPAGQEKLLVVFARHVDPLACPREKRRQSVYPVLRKGFPVHAGDADGLALAGDRHQGGAVDLEAPGKLLVERQPVVGRVLELRNLLGHKGAGYPRLRGDDGEGLLADFGGEVAAGKGAGEGALGQVFKVDADPLLRGNDSRPFPHQVQHLVQVLFAKGGDPVAQPCQLLVDNRHVFL